MPFVSDFTLPESANRLPLDSNTALFVAFISSNDPVTKQPWCPDVRAALPRLHAAFSGADAPKLAVVEVGQKPEWKDPTNAYRTTWSISSIPSLVRYQRVDGEPVETGRLAEGEILNQDKLQNLIS